MKIERRKLKTDKSDLLAHVRQLCASLQDKEQEMRDFIRNFEQRMRDNEACATKVSSDRERERWSLLKHAREEAERSIALAAQLNTRDIQLKRAQEQLQEVMQYFITLKFIGDYLLSLLRFHNRLVDSYLVVCRIKRVYYRLHH